MKTYENGPGMRPTFQPTGPMISNDGSISAFRSGDTSAFRALETIVEPGTIIDRYDVGRLIGRGGIAAVYEALHTETAVPAALKILDARFSSSPDIVSRFLAEAETLSSFDHPNIVRYHAHGQDEDFVYLAMEFVPGITLDQLLHAIPLESRHFLHLAREVSKGITCVHAAGVVHGDIKPSNILVTRPGEVKISDFGAAARAASLGLRAPNAKVLGTSSYIAPELLQPGHPVDYRADIFSLAVTFYKVFTGKLPTDPYIPPSMINPELPAELDDILDRGMRENPDDRFVTAKEFCDALAALFDENLQVQVPITPDPVKQEAAAAAAQQVTPLAIGKKKDPVDWKLVGLCFAITLLIGVAALLILM